MKCQLLLLITILFLHQSGYTQSTNILRDTTYSIRSAYEKIRQDYPFASPIEPQMPRKVQAKTDVVYTKSQDRALHLDIFYPSKKGKKHHPGVLLIHGGGWSSGSKAHQVPMAQQLARKNYVAAAVGYRLSPEAIYPAGIEDLQTALCWLRAHADEFGLDPENIAALGCSSGAQMASMLGTTGHVQAVVNIDGIVSFIHPEAAAEGNAAGRWLGGSRTKAAHNWREASPLEYANKQTPPFLFINSSIPRFHAGRDDLLKILDQYDTYSEVHTFPNSPHSFWLVHPWYKKTLKYTIRFLDRVF